LKQDAKTESRLTKFKKGDLYFLPLVLLFGGFLTDMLHHISDGESLNDFLFGMEGIFTPQHVLLPIGVMVLLTLVIIESIAPLKARTNLRRAS
jgi:hypothetical protein